MIVKDTIKDKERISTQVTLGCIKQKFKCQNRKIEVQLRKP